MIASTIRERLNRDPFEPFVIRSSREQAILVSSPDMAGLMKTEIFVAAFNSDRWAQVPYLHIAGLESPTNGRSGSNGKRRKR